MQMSFSVSTCFQFAILSSYSLCCQAILNFVCIIGRRSLVISSCSCGHYSPCLIRRTWSVKSYSSWRSWWEFSKRYFTTGWVTGRTTNCTRLACLVQWRRSEMRYLAHLLEKTWAIITHWIRGRTAWGNDILSESDDVVISSTDLGGLLGLELSYLFRLLSRLIRSKTKLALFSHSPSIHSSIWVNSSCKVRPDACAHYITEFDFFSRG